MLQRHIFIYLGGRNSCLGLFRAWGRLDLRRRSLSSRSSLARWGAPASPYILAIIYLSYVSRMLLSFFMIPIILPPVSFILLKKWWLIWEQFNNRARNEKIFYFIVIIKLFRYSPIVTLFFAMLHIATAWVGYNLFCFNINMLYCIAYKYIEVAKWNICNTVTEYSNPHFFFIGKSDYCNMQWTNSLVEKFN